MGLGVPTDYLVTPWLETLTKPTQPQCPSQTWRLEWIPIMLWIHKPICFRLPVLGLFHCRSPVKSSLIKNLRNLFLSNVDTQHVFLDLSDSMENELLWYSQRKVKDVFLGLACDHVCPLTWKCWRFCPVKVGWISFKNRGFYPAVVLHESVICLQTSLRILYTLVNISNMRSAGHPYYIT